MRLRAERDRPPVRPARKLPPAGAPFLDRPVPPPKRRRPPLPVTLYPDASPTPKQLGYLRALWQHMRGPVTGAQRRAWAKLTRGAVAQIIDVLVAERDSLTGATGDEIV